MLFDFCLDGICASWWSRQLLRVCIICAGWVRRRVRREALLVWLLTLGWGGRRNGCFLCFLFHLLFLCRLLRAVRCWLRGRNGLQFRHNVSHWYTVINVNKIGLCWGRGFIFMGVFWMRGPLRMRGKERDLNDAWTVSFAQNETLYKASNIS